MESASPDGERRTSRDGPRPQVRPPDTGRASDTRTAAPRASADAAGAPEIAPAPDAARASETRDEAARASGAAPPVDREKTLDRQIRAFHWVRLLAEIPHRVAGSPGEREAARRVESWMRELGFEEVAIRDVAGRPAPAASLAATLGVGALGLLLGGAAGAALALLAAGCFHWERRLSRPGPLFAWPQPDAALVLARTGAARPRRRVVLSAPLDAPRCGRAFGERLARRLGARRRRAGGALSWCERGLWLAAGLTAAGWLGASGTALELLTLVVWAGLALAAFMAFEWARGPASPGAGSASGVAALLTAAEQLLAQLREDVELWLVVGGGSHTDAAGMRAALDAHPEWRSDRTLLLHFDRVGGGALHTLDAEGALVRCEHPPRLRELARRLAAGGGHAEVSAAELVGDTDAGAAAARGLHVLALMALDEEGVPRGDHARDDVATALDMETVVRAADFGAGVVVAAWRGEADPLAII